MGIARASRLLACLALLSCAAAAEPREGCDGGAFPLPVHPWMPPPGVPRSVCEGIRNSLKCATAVETHLLAGKHEGVHRDDGRLLILPAGGPRVQFTDRRPGVHHDPEGLRFRYFGRLDNGNHVFFVQFHESSAFRLIHPETGRVSKLSGFPHLSPDGKRVVSGAPNHMCTGVSVSVHRLAGDGLEPELREFVGHGGEIMGWSHAFDWVDASRIRLCAWTGERPGRLYRLERGEDGWLVRAPE